MNITILSTSDSTGGAAVVSKRLVQAFINEGHEARLLVLNAGRNGDDRVYGCNKGLIPRSTFYKERIDIFFRNGFNRNDLFKVSTATTGYNITDNPLVKQADVIIMGWINQGFLSLKNIEEICSLGKPVLWVMHDQWCMTGICHLPGSCRRFTDRCGECKYLHWMKGPHDLSWRIWHKKNTLYNHYKNLRFVAVSHWLADKALQSSLLRDHNIEVVPNPVTIPTLPLLNVEHRRPVIVMGAARLDEDVKNLPLAIDSMNMFYDEYRHLYPDVSAVFFGNIRNAKILQQLRLPYHYLGPITNETTGSVFNNASVVLSTSHFEMLPTTIVEGLMWGCRAVATDSGGQSDIIVDGRNGFLTKGAAPCVSQAILQALQLNVTSQELRESVAIKFSPRRIAGDYLQIIERMS